MLDDFILISTDASYIKINGLIYSEPRWMDMPNGEARVICKDELGRYVMFAGFYSMYGSAAISPHPYTGKMIEDRALQIIGG